MRRCAWGRDAPMHHAGRGKKSMSSVQANAQLSAMRRFSSSASSSWLTTGFLSHVTIRPSAVFAAPATNPPASHTTQPQKGLYVCVALVCTVPSVQQASAVCGGDEGQCIYHSCYGGGGSSPRLATCPRCAPLHELIQKRAALVKDLLSAE